MAVTLRGFERSILPRFCLDALLALFLSFLLHLVSFLLVMSDSFERWILPPSCLDALLAILYSILLVQLGSFRLVMSDSILDSISNVWFVLSGL